jgi:glycosyltransferase involved in cell wall biosynthesis
MIDVIIPAYNAHDTLEDGLYSILMQQMSHLVNVYIVDDCSTKGYDSIVKKFDGLLKITVLKTPKNSGPGFARQYGIDASRADYIIFMDADDQFYNAVSFNYLFNTITKNNSDVATSQFIEEIGEERETKIHGDNDIWMHGKIYKRSFLKENRIRFNSTSANEDTGFNKTIYLLTDNISYIDQITYIWKYNPNSFTRKNNYEYSLKGLEGFIYNICYAIKHASGSKDNIEKRAKVVFETIYEVYYNYIYFKNYENSDLILDWSKDLKKLYTEYFYLVDPQIRIDALEYIQKKMLDEMEPDILVNNELGFDHFIDLIK